MKKKFKENIKIILIKNKFQPAEMVNMKIIQVRGVFHGII